MATTVHEPPKIERERFPSQGSGNGGGRNFVPASGDLRRVKDPSSPPPASTGIWVGLAAITMSFAAFTSAMIVRQGTAPLQHITLPPVLYLNTLLIIASSITLEVARRRIANFMGGVRDQAVNPARCLYITLFLGLLFVAGQTSAWVQ